MAGELVLSDEDERQIVVQLNTICSRTVQGRDERYDVVSGTTVRALVLGRFDQKIEQKIVLKDTAKTNKNKKI